MKSYDYKNLDSTWQKIWEDEKIYQTPHLPGNKKAYILDMFPYPSGEGLHVGHPKGYIATDIYSRFKRMNGYDVLHPMGWDAFGLPAEQFALKNKIHPRVAVEKNIANFKSQLSHLGLDYDWSREINTTDPGFYKWTQWIFTKLYEKGLAYESHEPINWCPSCKTGLANEDLDGNKCERCESVVEKKPLRQWVLKITDYADRMLTDLETLNWPEGVKLAQKNWIGRSEGAEFDFELSLPIEESLKFEDVFTEDLLNGKKTVTIRLDKKGLVEGAFFTVKNTQGDDIGVAVVKKVDEKKFKDLNLNNPYGTSYQDKGEQLAAYKKYYGENVTEDSVFCEIHFNLVEKSIRVFTTRADTLFGATFVAISAEKAKSWIDGGFTMSDDVKLYIKEAIEESMKDHDYSHVPEKTGICSGVYAINPATKEQIPVWIANYVLGGVGTGAIMAVPAHDNRDFEFANKYNLPIKTVINPVYIRDDVKAQVVEQKNKIVAIVENQEGNILCINWGPKMGGKLFLGGTVEEGESPEVTAVRELAEETGYDDVEVLAISEEVFKYTYYAFSKEKYYCANTTFVHIRLKSNHNKGASLEENEKNKFEVLWLSKVEAGKEVVEVLHKRAYDLFVLEIPYVGEGSLTASASYNGLTSDEARNSIIEAFDGKKVVTYKIQDWTFARQRYWGEPFPVVRDENGKVYMVDESELPVLLPDVESYEPTGTGESPLAAITDWVNVKGYITEKGTFKTSSDGQMFTRETNTMPQWAGSSWYYLRFADPHNDTSLIDPAIEKSWLPVDVYVGGDHATRHLIYARFWHKFLYDIGVVSTIEPFSRLEFLGFILAEDGRKMSKRLGNVINPDDVVAEYGADTLRVYEMFMAPFEQTATWSTSSIKGSYKFLDKVYKYYSVWLRNFELDRANGDTTYDQDHLTEARAALFHKTIKKVTEDIENFKFNTAISALMILLNSFYDLKEEIYSSGVVGYSSKSEQLTINEFSIFLRLLAPFAPHITEQVWKELGNTTSIHKEPWPTYNEDMLVDSEITYVLQVNGKVRGSVVVPKDADKESILAAIRSLDGYVTYVGNAIPKKEIIVPGKLINIVI